MPSVIPSNYHTNSVQEEQLEVNEVKVNGEVLMTTRNDTVSPQTLVRDETATNSEGKKITGELDSLGEAGVFYHLDTDTVKYTGVIEANADLNNYYNFGMVGTYFCNQENAATLSHCPVDHAFKLVVDGLGAECIRQTITLGDVWDTSEGQENIYTRIHNKGIQTSWWTNWEIISYKNETFTYDKAKMLHGTDDLNNLGGSVGTYCWIGNGSDGIDYVPSNVPEETDGFMYHLYLGRDNGHPQYRQIVFNPNNNNIFERTYDGTTWGDWIDVVDAKPHTYEKGTQIPQNSDFNSYTTEGVYFVDNATDAATMTNIPLNVDGGKEAGKLIVMDRDTHARLFQIYIVSRKKVYFRDMDNSSNWLEWVRIANIYDIAPSIAKVGKSIVPTWFYSSNVSSNNGITYTFNPLTGEVTANGTSSNNGSTCTLYHGLFRHYLAKGTYIMSGCPSGGSSNTYCLIYGTQLISGTKVSYKDYGDGVTINLSNDAISADSDCDFAISISPNQNVNNIVFKPMIRPEWTTEDFEPCEDIHKGNSYVGTCATAAGTKDKVAFVDGYFVLRKGVRVAIRFTNTNTYSNVSSSPITLNVNNTGAKTIWYGTTHSGNGNTGEMPFLYGKAFTTAYYMYDGTYWVWDGDSTNFLRNDANAVMTSETPYLGLKSSEIDISLANNNVSETKYPALAIIDKNNQTISRVESVVEPSGNVSTFLYVGNIKTSDGTYALGGIKMTMDKNGDILWNIQYATQLRNHLGMCYCNCDTAEATTTKTAVASNFNLLTGSFIVVRFLYKVPANSTLNINSSGDIPICFLGSNIQNDVILANDKVTLVYDGANYAVISIDRFSNVNTLNGLISNRIDSSLSSSSINAIQNSIVTNELATKYKKYSFSWTYKIEITFTTGSGASALLVTSKGIITLGTSGSKVYIRDVNLADTGEWTYTVSGLKITLNSSSHAHGFILSSDEITFVTTNTSTPQANSFLELDTAIRTARVYDAKTWIGTCATAAATSAKIITVEDEFTLYAGVRIGVKFSETNTASNCTLNVNSTGNYSIYYSSSVYTGSSEKVTGYANRYTYYVYDGTYWVWDGWGVDENTKYSAMSQAEANVGTATTSRTITAEVLRNTAIPTTATVIQVSTLVDFWTIAESLMGNTNLCSFRCKFTSDFGFGTGWWRVIVGEQNRVGNGTNAIAGHVLAMNSGALRYFVVNGGVTDTSDLTVSTLGAIATEYSNLSIAETQTGTETASRFIQPSVLSALLTAKAPHVGTCATPAATAAKEATISDSNFSLYIGAVIGIKFSESNTATNCTLNVNSTGAYQIYYNNAVYTSDAETICGYANRYTFYMWDGTYWVWLNHGYEANSTYSSMSLAELQTGTATSNRSLKATILNQGIQGYATAIGTCDTNADVSAKVVTLNDNNWQLRIGAVISVKFTNSNTASNCTLDVNGTGAASVWYNNAVNTGDSTYLFGTADRYISYQWDGTYWVWIGNSYIKDTTYSPQKLGFGYATDSRDSAAAAVTATCSNYTLVNGGYVSVYFNYDVPANATLNVNGKGNKQIRHRNARITADKIKAGDLATFIYNGSYYMLCSNDRYIT